MKADYGSEWIFALPISACGLRISNEAFRIAIGLRLGLNICESHSCPCGGVVDAKGIHGLSCKCGAGRSIRHQQITDLVWRALRRIDTPSIKDPSGLLPGDDKRPNGLTLVSWQGGRFLAWLSLLQAHDALFLLKNTIAIPRRHYLRIYTRC